jgi:hypothetical protein
VAALLAGCGREDGAALRPPRASTDVVVKVRLAERRYPPGSPVALEVLVTNVGAGALLVPAGRPGVAGRFRFGFEVEAEGPGGVPLAPVAPPGPRVPPGPEDFVLLEPGAALAVPVEVGDFVGTRGEGPPLSHRMGAGAVRVRMTSAHGAPPPAARGAVAWTGASAWARAEYEIGH